MLDGTTRAGLAHEVPGRRVLKKEGPLSLSSHLENRGSPVRRWLEERFPETRGITREANRQLRGGEPTCPIPASPRQTRVSSEPPSTTSCGAAFA